MKATGIVRRIGVKNGFWAVFIHSKSEVEFHLAFVVRYYGIYGLLFAIRLVI